MSLYSNWLALTRQKKMILLACLAVFLPFYFTSIIHLLILIFALIKGDLQVAFKDVKGAKYIIPFSIFSLMVSLFSKNYLGILCTIVVLVLLEMIVFYQKYSDEILFNQIVKIFIFMSIFCGIYALMEYNGILYAIGIENFEVIIMDSPHVRLNSVFFNANYYAMMLEFFVLMAFYEMMNEKNKVIKYYYLAVILFNLFLLYLSGCRTAWPALAIGILMLTLNREDKRWLLGYLGFCCLLAILFFFKPEAFPRIDNIEEYFLGRVNIWKVSWDHIKTHFLFGNGPLTYLLIYPQYENAIYTQHAHNIFIDPILSYGLVGVAMIFPYFKERFKEWKMVKRNSNSYCMMSAFLMTTIIHGLLDYTVYFIPTGFTFLLVLTSSFTSKKQEQQF